MTVLQTVPAQAGAFFPLKTNSTHLIQCITLKVTLPKIRIVFELFYKVSEMKMKVLTFSKSFTLSKKFLKLFLKVFTLSKK